MSILTRPAGSGPAVVLRTWPSGETSVVASVLTAAHGPIRLIAKGARAQKSRLRPLVQPGRLVDLEFSLDASRELQFLRGGSLTLDPLLSATRLEVTAYLQAALEIVDRCDADTGDAAALFALCHDFIRVLSCADSGREAALFYAFEVALLDWHGVRPRLEHCVLCERERSALGERPRWLVASAGGMVCADCADEASLAGARPLTTATAAAWEELAAVPSRWPGCELPRTVARDWGVILHRFLEYHLPTYRLPSALDLLRAGRRSSAANAAKEGC